jgi:hypothetical protein
MIRSRFLCSVHLQFVMEWQVLQMTTTISNKHKIVQITCEHTTTYTHNPEHVTIQSIRTNDKKYYVREPVWSAIVQLRSDADL